MPGYAHREGGGKGDGMRRREREGDTMQETARQERWDMGCTASHRIEGTPASSLSPALASSLFASCSPSGIPCGSGCRPSQSTASSTRFRVAWSAMAAFFCGNPISHSALRAACETCKSEEGASDAHARVRVEAMASIPLQT